MCRRLLPAALLVACLAAPCWLAASADAQTAAQSRARHQPMATVGAPPHAWLFGTWTGGLFPVLEGMARQDCRTQPTVTFGKDELSHATLTNPGMVARVVETVRADPKSAEFRLTPDPADPAGFGCDGPDALNVAREAEDTITFPHCPAFPYPLQRCPVS